MIQHTLENGFSFFIDPEGEAPVAAAYLWIDVGSRDEPKGMEGAAHMLEHMLFKGTERFGVGEIAGAVESLGGDINAWTSFDETCFFIHAPSERILEATQILAEMLCKARLDAAELAQEKKVILEEIRGCAEDPDQVVGEALYAAAFSGHPYGRPVIGSMRSVRGISREALADFYQYWYTPANARLAIAGPVDADRLTQQLQGLFLQGGSRPVRPLYPQPPRLGKRQAIKNPFEGARIETAFPGPGHRHPDVPLLDLLAAGLGGGASARLEACLKLKEGLCLSAGASYEAESLGGVFTVQLRCTETQANAALKRADELLAEVLAQGLSRAELERAKAQILTDRAFTRETVEGRAHTMVFHAAQGDVDAWKSYDAAIEAATLESVLKAAQSWIIPEAASRVWIGLPASFKAQKPVLKKPETRIVPAQKWPARVLLDNGIRVLLEPGGHSIAAAKIIGLGGQLLEEPTSIGRVMAWSRLLLRGAGGLDGVELAGETERLGASLSVPVGRFTQGLKIDVPGKELFSALELAWLIVAEPEFAAPELAQIKKDMVEGFKEAADSAASVLSWKLAELCYPNQVAGQIAFGTTATRKNITPKQLHRLHQRWSSGCNLVVSLSGDFDPERALRFLRRTLGRLERGTPIPYQEPVFPATPQKALAFAGRDQAWVGASFKGVRLDNPLQPAVEVLSAVLGGQGGRLFLDLREKLGLAYSVGAVETSGLTTGLLLASLGTESTRSEEAETELLKSLLRVAEDGVAPQEIERAKAWLVGAALAEHQTAGARASGLVYSELAGFDGLNYRELARKVEGVGEKEVREAAQLLKNPLAVVWVLPVQRGRR
jgi:zinc protease